MLKQRMHFLPLLSIEKFYIKMSSSPKSMPQASHKKNISQIPIEGHFTK